MDNEPYSGIIEDYGVLIRLIRTLAYGTSFNGVFDKIFIKMPQFHKPPAYCPEKFLAAHLHSGIILFKNAPSQKFDSILNTSVSLDNCSVICIVTLCYVLHLAHSEFGIFNRFFQVYASIFNYIQRY